MGAKISKCYSSLKSITGVANKKVLSSNHNRAARPTGTLGCGELVSMISFYSPSVQSVLLVWGFVLIKKGIFLLAYLLTIFDIIVLFCLLLLSYFFRSYWHAGALIVMENCRDVASKGEETSSFTSWISVKIKTDPDPGTPPHTHTHTSTQYTPCLHVAVRTTSRVTV